MNNIDYIIIAILLIFLLMGYYKGLVSVVVGMFGFLASIFLSYKLFPVMSNFLISNFSLDVKINTWILEKIPKIAEHMLLNSEQYKNLSEETKTFLTNNPDVISEYVANMDLTILDALSLKIINFISIILLFVFFKIIFKLLGRLLNRIMKLPILNEINKACGAILGGIYGVIIVYVMIFVISFLPFKELQNDTKNSIIGSKIDNIVPKASLTVLEQIY